MFTSSAGGSGAPGKAPETKVDSTSVATKDEHKLSSPLIVLAGGGPHKTVSRPKTVMQEALVTRRRKTKTRGKGRSRAGVAGEDAMRARIVSKVFSETAPPAILMRVPTHLNLFRASRMLQGSVISSSATVATFSSVTLRLDAIDQYTEFTSLFDQFRFTRVEVWFIPRTTAVQITDQQCGLLTTVIDLDDATVLATMAEAYAYSTAQTAPGITGQYRSFTPAYETTVAVTGGGFTGEAIGDGWVDCNSPSTLWHGVKTAWTVAGAIYSMDVMARVHMEFRTVR